MARQPFPVREKGYVNPDITTSGYWASNFDEDEVVAALRWPQSLRIYDQMRTDSQIKPVFAAVTLPVRRTTYRVDPRGASEAVVRLVAEDLGLPVKGGDPDEYPQRPRSAFSWNEHLRLALLELRYGHMFFERVYEIVDGKARLAKLSPRMPRTISAINVAQDGSLISVEQLAPSTPAGVFSTSVVIPAPRLVAYVNELEGSNWLGTSMFRPAYKHWVMRDRLSRIQAQTASRNGMGIPVYTAAETETDLDNGEAITTSVRAGDNAGAAIPNGAKLELVGVTGTLPNVMEAINYHDQAIVRSALANFLTLGGATGNSPGSYNLGNQSEGFFTMSLQTIADHICDVMTRQVVADMVAVNFGPDEPVPAIVCDDIGSQMDATAQAILALAQAGVLANLDPITKRYIYQRFSLPMAPDGEEPPPEVDESSSSDGPLDPEESSSSS